MKVRDLIVEGDPARKVFWCPGCDELHFFQVAPGTSPLWRWNDDPEAPTVEPSIKVTEVAKDRILVCHSWIEGGRIRFLGDSTHDLANQTVDLPDLPDDTP